MTRVDAVSSSHILQVGGAYWTSRVLLSAVQFGVFTELAQAGPLSMDALQTRLNLKPRGTREFLDALVSLGFLERTPGGLYGNTPEADVYLDASKPSYVGQQLEKANERLHSFIELLN